MTTPLTPHHVLTELFQEDAFVKKVAKRQATMTLDRLCDAGFEIVSTGEIERLRGALEVIAGATTDQLQAIQARSALDNIG